MIWSVVIPLPGSTPRILSVPCNSLTPGLVNIGVPDSNSGGCQPDSPGGGGNPSGLNPRSLAISIAVTPHPKNGTALRSDNPAPVISPCDALYAASPNAITVPTPGTSLPVFATALVALLVANFLVAFFPPLLASFLLILFALKISSPGI